MEMLKVKEFKSNKELCDFVNDMDVYPTIEAIVVFNGVLQLFYYC